MRNILRQLFRGRTAEQENVSAREATRAGSPPTELRFQPSVEHFGELVAGVRDYAIFLLDENGHIATWNAGAERIKGYRADEIIGQHFSRFYPNDAISSAWPAHELSVAAATGRFEDEGWRVRKDGSQFWANVVITALRSENGDVRGFLKITRDLTDRKQAEEKLRLSEERFRLLVDGVRDHAIFMLDASGRVATWNSGAERLKGYRADEVIGQHFSVFYPAEAVARGWPEEEIRRAAKTGQFEDEGWRVRKDGTTFWANVVITALRDSSGNIRGFSKITRDLTDRRQAEENARKLLQEEAARKAAETSAREIERQREQLRVTLASIGDAVIVTDCDGVITFLNAVAAGLTGWRQDEAVGQPLDQVFRIINERTRRPVENPVTRVLRERKVVALANHTSLIAKDGRETPIEDTAAPIVSNGESIDGTVLVFRDVTQTRRAVETRLHLAAIVESSDDAIISKGLDGTITSWNQGAERLYGFRPEEIIGQPLTRIVPPDRHEEVPEILDRIRRGERIEHFETVRLRKNGSSVDVSLTVSPIRDSEGNVVGASKIARDITAHKEEDRRKNEFLAMLAHELRNPLAPLRNGLEVISMAGDDRQSIDHACRIMQRQLQHLVRLVDDLLDVSRISRGKLHLRVERISLEALISHVLDLSGQLVSEYGHELTVHLPDERIDVDVDKTRLAQAVGNLLSNAVKYSDPGSRIWLHAARENGKAVIRVKDTGIGIPPHLLPTVFDMFTQIESSQEKSQGGLGVGLTVVKRLVEMHGGQVEAHSEGAGHGSEFVIRLPIAETVSDPEVKEAKKPAPARVSRRILVVDDNVDAAGSLAMLLKLMGNEVRTAHDGVAAVEIAADFRPEMILMDIGMPKMNGHDTARFIRQQTWGKDTILVAVTGWGQEEDRQRSKEAGFDFHVIKPVEPSSLERLLADVAAS